MSTKYYKRNSFCQLNRFNCCTKCQSQYQCQFSLKLKNEIHHLRKFPYVSKLHPKWVLEKNKVNSVVTKFCVTSSSLEVFWKYAGNLQNNFIEITLRHGCPPVNLLHIFTTSSRQNTSGELVLLCLQVFYKIAILTNQEQKRPGIESIFSIKIFAEQDLQKFS